MKTTNSGRAANSEAMPENAGSFWLELAPDIKRQMSLMKGHDAANGLLRHLTDLMEMERRIYFVKSAEMWTMLQYAHCIKMCIENYNADPYAVAPQTQTPQVAVPSPTKPFARRPVAFGYQGRMWRPAKRRRTR